MNAKGAKVREGSQRETRVGLIKGLVLDNQRLCAVMRKPAEITRQNSINAKVAKDREGKTKNEWLEFYGRRNRHKIWDKEKFLKIMERKRSEGFFGNTLFVIFAVEREEEVVSKWMCFGEEIFNQSIHYDIYATTKEGEANGIDFLLKEVAIHTPMQ